VKIQKRDVDVFEPHVGIEGIDAVFYVTDHRCDSVGEVIANADAACLTFLCIVNIGRPAGCAGILTTDGPSNIGAKKRDSVHKRYLSIFMTCLPLSKNITTSSFRILEKQLHRLLALITPIETAATNY
jgi:hypothetical protein